jgi:hypothetical protein
MTQVSATYALAVDLQNNLGYADSGDDISAYWKSITVDYGMAAPGDHFGRSAQMTVLLNNGSHKFSPQHASALSGFTVGRKIRLQMTYSATTVTLFEGRIDNIAPAPGATIGTQDTMVRSNGYMVRLQNDETGISIQNNANSSQLITAILNNVHEYPAMLTGFYLGNTVWGVLGVTTALSGGAASFANIETGGNTYDFAGDNFQAKASPYGALRDVTESERGWFFEGRDGKLNFWGRAHLVKDLVTAVDATLADTDVTPIKYSYGSTLITTADVNYHPRAIDGVGVQLGVSDKPIRFNKTKPATVTIRFTNESGNRIGATDVITPQAGIDYTATGQPNGKGTELTKYVRVLMKAFGDRAELTFSTSLNHKIYISRVQVRGTIISDFGAQKISYDDATARGLYGRAYKQIDARMVEDGDLAQDIALWEVACHNTPTGNLEEVGFYANKSAALMGYARDLDIGSRVALTETQTGVNNEYFIIGKHIELQPQNIHYEKWILEPKPVQTFFMLGATGFDALGTTTYLGA